MARRDLSRDEWFPLVALTVSNMPPCPEGAVLRLVKPIQENRIDLFLDWPDRMWCTSRSISVDDLNEKYRYPAHVYRIVREGWDQMMKDYADELKSVPS